jgi:hypothetical protein
MTDGEDFSAAGLINFFFAKPSLNLSYVHKNYSGYEQGKPHHINFSCTDTSNLAKYYF